MTDTSADLPPAQFITANLNAAFTPLVARFVAWRQRTVPDRSPVDVAGLVSPSGETAPRDVAFSPAGLAKLRDWPHFLHTFSRDSAWDVPVGAYGQQWAHQLGAIAEALRHDWDVFAESDEQCRLMLSSLDKTLLYTSTFWGATYATQEPNWWETAPGQTMREGITSVAQALAMLTLDAVDGYTSGLQLAHDIAATGLLDRFAIVLPLNTLQPMIASHKLLPGPVVVRTANGGLDFSAEVGALLTSESRMYRDMMARRTPDEREKDGAAGAGHGCPVAVAVDGGPSALAQVAALFEWLIIQLTQPPGRPQTA